jgi:predicted HicB family RNase H-like nuclease
MAYTEAGKRATMKYVKENYDRLNIKVPKGQRETIAAYAEAAGESVNMYTQKALLMRMGLSDWKATEEE